MILIIKRRHSQKVKMELLPPQPIGFVPYDFEFRDSEDYEDPDNYEYILTKLSRNRLFIYGPDRDVRIKYEFASLKNKDNFVNAFTRRFGPRNEFWSMQILGGHPLYCCFIIHM